MINFKHTALVLLFWAAPAAAAGDYTIQINAVHGKETYNYTHKAPEGEQSNYVGKVKGEPGITRGIILPLQSGTISGTINI